MKTKTAIVTGGSRGIGAAIAEALAGQGIIVGLTYNTNHMLAEKVVDRIEQRGGQACTLAMHVEQRESVQNAFSEFRDRFGSVSILVNNAAIAQEKPFEKIDDHDWDAMMGINLRGPFACCQQVLPDMLNARWGRIINITSIGGQWGGINQVHYAASKAGLIGFTRSLARLYSADGITTNAIAPGLVATDMARSELDSSEGRKKVESIPSGRIATLEEIAGTVTFLVSDEAAYITGQTINVNGGMLFST